MSEPKRDYNECFLPLSRSVSFFLLLSPLVTIAGYWTQHCATARPLASLEPKPEEAKTRPKLCVCVWRVLRIWALDPRPASLYGNLAIVFIQDWPRRQNMQNIFLFSQFFFFYARLEEANNNSARPAPSSPTDAFSSRTHAALIV